MVLAEDAGSVLVSLHQPITLGNSLSFRLPLTENLAPGAFAPDSFTAYLLDDNDQALLPSNDPLRALLLALTLPPGPDALQVFTDGVRARYTDRVLPEPGSFALLTAGLLGLAWRSRQT